jgi:hypothetical protein
LGIPKIADFGLAKHLVGDSALTRTGETLGTPTYIAPEQIGGGKPLGPATDVYGLGGILYECLTGRPPFLGRHSLEVLLRVQCEDPIPPRRLVPAVPLDLQTIALKCLDKDPARRYGSAAELADDLGRFLAGEPILARPIGAAARIRKWARRRPGAAALAAALVLVAILGLLLTVWQWLRAEKERHRADVQVRARAEVGKLAVRHRLEIERLRLGGEVDQAIGLCALGEVNRGMLSLVRCLEKAQAIAARSGRPDPLERVIRTNLAAWSPHVQCRQGSALPDAGRVWLEEDSPAGRTGPTPRAPLRHSRAVRSVAFSQDGRTFTTACDDGQTRRWRTATGQLLVTSRHPGGGGEVAFSRDGRTIFVTSPVGVRRLSAATGQPTAALLPHEGGVSTLSLCGDDRRLLTAGGTQRKDCVRLWDVTTGRQLQHWSMPHAIHSLAWHPKDSQRFLTGGDRLAQLWALEGKPIGPPLVHRDAVRVVGFSPDGQTILTGSDDRTVRLWDSATGKPLGPELRHGAGVASAAFHPSGKWLLAGCRDGMARFWGVPAPVPGEAEQLRLRVEVLTGMQLDAGGAIQVLPHRDWLKRRQRSP